MKKRMPKIELGDWVCVRGRVERVDAVHHLNGEVMVFDAEWEDMADVTEIRGERKGKAFIWRRDAE